MNPAWPIPTSVYPIPPGRVPERPWWILVSGFDWRRGDGAIVDGAGGREALAAYDRAHPRPRPPYRGGQIWGWADSGTLLVTASGPGEGEPLGAGRPETACLLFDPLDPSAAPWSPFEGEP